jgi:hypothetical protein
MLCENKVNYQGFDLMEGFTLHLNYGTTGYFPPSGIKKKTH